MNKTIKTSLLALSIALAAFSTNSLLAQREEQYNPKQVLSFVDMQRSETHIYLLGENHSQSDQYYASLNQLAKDRHLFFLMEGIPYDEYVLTKEGLSSDSSFNIGIEDVLIKALGNFLAFRRLYTLSDGISSKVHVMALSAIKGIRTLYQDYRTEIPALNKLIEQSRHKRFYALFNNELIPDAKLLNDVFFESASAAALELLELIQKTSKYAFSQEEYRQLEIVLKAKNQDLLDIQAVGMQIAIINKRNEVFAENIASIHNQVKKKNLPIVVPLGRKHLEDVSALLKQKGISHTRVDLETMQATEVLTETKGDSFYHNDL